MLQIMLGLIYPRLVSTSVFKVAIGLDTEPRSIEKIESESSVSQYLRPWASRRI